MEEAVFDQRSDVPLFIMSLSKCLDPNVITKLEQYGKRVLHLKAAYLLLYMLLYFPIKAVTSITRSPALLYLVFEKGDQSSTG